MTIKRRNKLPKRLKERCKKLRIRITMVRNGKRVYKTKKAILKECKKKLKSKLKKKRKIKRKNKFGMIPDNNNNIQIITKYIKRLDELDTPSNIYERILYIFRDKILERINLNERNNFLTCLIIISILHDGQTIKAVDILKDQNSKASYEGIDGVRKIFENTNSRDMTMPALINKVRHYRNINMEENDVQLLINSIPQQIQQITARGMISFMYNNHRSLMNFIYQDFIYSQDNNNTVWLKSLLQNDKIKKLIKDSNFFQSNNFTTIPGKEFPICYQPDCVSSLDGVLAKTENNNIPVYHRYSTCIYCRYYLALLVQDNNGNWTITNNLTEATHISLNHTILEREANKYIIPTDFNENDFFETNGNPDSPKIFKLESKEAEKLVNNLHKIHKQVIINNGSKKSLGVFNYPVNLFSLFDGSDKGDTPKFTNIHAKYLHSTLFERNEIVRNYYPNNFENEHSTETTVYTKILKIRDSDFLYSLENNTNQNRPDFFLRVGKSFNVCIVPGVEGKLLQPIEINDVGQNSFPYVLTDHIDYEGIPSSYDYNDGERAYYVTPYDVNKMNAILTKSRVSDRKIRRFVWYEEEEYYTTRIYNDNNNIPSFRRNDNGDDENFYVLKGSIQEVQAFELVLENEQVSRWVCLKVASSRIKFERTILGYLNNYSINNISQPMNQNGHIFPGNFKFEAPSDAPSPIPNRRPRRDQRQWGFIKLNLQNQRGGRTNIPNQYIYQKSSQGCIALVWYYPRGQNLTEPKYMFISNSLPTNEFLSYFSWLQEHNILNNNYTFHNRVVVSAMNYKRLLDPIQFLSLREYLRQKSENNPQVNRISGQFVTRDFMCFVQVNYLKNILQKYNEINLIWQDGDNLIIRGRDFGTTKQNKKDIHTLIKEILDELEIETYFDFIITINNNDKVIVKHFVNPYILEQYSENTIVKKNMDKILKQLGCKSFNQQITGKLRQMKKERVLEEQISKEQIFEKIRQMKKERILEEKLKQRDFLRIPFINSENIYKRTTIVGAYGKKKVKRRFLYNPNNPKKSFDVYIDKNPKDTIPIKYTTVKDVRNTIRKLERLYKTNKYPHTRIWKVGMILKVRLEAIVKNTRKKKEHFRHAKNYFHFLGQRTKKKGDARKKMVFKFNKTYRKVS